VKVVQKEESAGQRGRQKRQSLVPSRKSTAQPNQEDSEGLSLNHMYLRKGSIWP
jgi:hypothetical protein